MTRVYIIKSKEQDNLRNKLKESRSQLSDLTKNLSSTVKGQSSLRSSLEESQSQLSDLRNTVQRFGERLETYEERVGKHMISTIQQIFHFAQQCPQVDTHGASLPPDSNLQDVHAVSAVDPAKVRHEV